MPKITPFLWFDNEAEAAAKFYVSVFKKSKIKKIARYNAVMAQAAARPAGSVMVVDFEINGQRLTALNGGPMFKLTEAFSFVVECETQAEVDYYWKKLSAGGKPNCCGWLKDKYGLSWQIVPRIMLEFLHDKDAAKAQRVMQAMLQMNKLNIAKLKAAAKTKTHKPKN